MRSCRWIITPGAAAGCCTTRLDKRRLTAWQRELGAALVIVASWVVEDYQDPPGGLADAACDATGA
jgi:hypothetical protein